MNNYRRNSKPHSRLLPYATIRAASEGDPDAVNAVLRHYEGYITRLAMRQLHDEYGNTYLCVDEATRPHSTAPFQPAILQSAPR